MNRYEITLPAGEITIETTREEWSLDEALGFASRQNPNRSFLFVSKILGKYVPVRPARMRKVFRHLAKKLGPVNGPALFIGMAETATGLGHGVFDEVRRKNPELPGMYMHSTRHPLELPIAFSFEESHSHAISHFLHAPRPEFRKVFETAKTLVLVDDEITTGDTLRNLAEVYIQQHPQVERVVFLTLVSWLKAENIERIGQKLGKKLEVIPLISGNFSFAPDPNYSGRFPEKLKFPNPLPLQGRADVGRLGIADFDWKSRLDLKALCEDLPEKLIVLGTGEFNFIPFLAAEWLENHGFDVEFLSTSRSPITVGNAIRSKIEFTDHHREGIPNYIYNLPAGRYPVVLYENRQLLENHDLPEFLNARRICLYD